MDKFFQFIISILYDENDDVLNYIELYFLFAYESIETKKGNITNIKGKTKFTHCGTGRFCFCFFAKTFLIFNVLCDAIIFKSETKFERLSFCFILYIIQEKYIYLLKLRTKKLFFFG